MRAEASAASSETGQAGCPSVQLCAKRTTEGWGAPLFGHGFRPETQAVPGVQPDKHQAVDCVGRNSD